MYSVLQDACLKIIVKPYAIRAGEMVSNTIQFVFKITTMSVHSPTYNTSLILCIMKQIIRTGG